jgi:hypothetical protein
MPSNLAQLRAALRIELRDEDAAAYLWTDAVLNRHLAHALQHVQVAAPVFASLTKTMPPDRRVDLTADVPATFLWLDAVEHPVDRFPNCFHPFREEAGPKLYFLTAELPPAGEALAVWYAHGYTVTEGASDLPAELDRAVLLGARAFALADQAVDTADKLTPRDTVEAYRKLAAEARGGFGLVVEELRSRLGGPRWRVSWELDR